MTALCIAAITPLGIVRLGQDLPVAGTSDSSYFEDTGAALAELRDRMTGLLMPFVLSLGAEFFYWLFSLLRLVPKFNLVWGPVAVASLITYNMLETFGAPITCAMAPALPIMLKEIFLVTWLIVRGFRLGADRAPVETNHVTVHGSAT